ncbi:MAG: hypothetical protein GKR99_12470 [Rhodobacteraceae bacterium]|nr:hypothetical protein [Paracoccaceae bacterium]NKB28314.1 hypothetical protein [Paracoccaceae bacterium]
MAESVTSVPDNTGASRVAILAGVISGAVGTALFQALLPLTGASSILEILIMVIPVGVVFGVTMAWLGRRYGGFGPVWASLMILAAPLIYYMAVMLAAQVYSLANDFGVRNASVALALAGACAGAAALLLVTMLRRRRVLAGAAMVVVISAIAGALALVFGFSDQGGSVIGYFIIHVVWRAAFLSTFLFTLTSSEQR